MIDIVITSCGRFELTKRTILSLLKYNTYLVNCLIIIEDSDSRIEYEKINEFIDKYPGGFPCKSFIIHNTGKLGQVKAIDIAYQYITTEYFLHCENDWLFTRPGFIEKSLAVLEANPKILTVWLRDMNDTNTHPVETDKTYSIYDTNLENKITDYYLMGINALGGNWHGFTWNPGLRRLSDYNLIAPFSSFLQPGDFAALTECRIGQRYFELGYRAAILPEGYCKHIG